MRPGVALSILNLKIEGVFNASNNYLITTCNSLISALWQKENVLPPTVGNSSVKDYIAFSLLWETFQFWNAVYSTDLLYFYLRHVPVLETSIKESLPNGYDNQFEIIMSWSRHFTTHLLANTSNIDLRSHLYDELDFEDRSLTLIEQKREKGGARTRGWIKHSSFNQTMIKLQWKWNEFGSFQSNPLTQQR